MPIMPLTLDSAVAWKINAIPTFFPTFLLNFLYWIFHKNPGDPNQQPTQSGSGSGSSSSSSNQQSSGNNQGGPQTNRPEQGSSTHFHQKY